MSKQNRVFAKVMGKLFSSRSFRFLLLWLVPFAVLSSSFFTVLLNSLNYEEVFPTELIFPLVIHLITALFIALIIYFIPKPRMYSSKVVAVFLLGLVMVGYNDRLNIVAGLYRAILPSITSASSDMPIISGVFIITLFAVAIFIGTRIDKLQKRHTSIGSHNLILAVLVFSAVIFVGQGVRFGIMLPSIIKESRAQSPVLNKTATDKLTTKPDIYYIVLDRYASSNVLKNQFGYDNSQITNYLNKNDFYINQDAYSNYPLTSMSISSTLNAEYTKQESAEYKDNSVQSRALYHNLIRESAVVKALKQDGYKYYSIGSTYGASYKAPLADVDYGHSNSISIFGRLSKNLRGIEVGQFNQSPYYQFFKVNIGWWPLKTAELDTISYDRMQLDTLNQLASQKSSGGRFIFAHILLPHDPFVFNADGSTSGYQGTDNWGKTIKSKYLDQLKFTNSQIMQTIDNIKQNSGGKAVIILNADEGAYPQDMNNTNMTPVDSSNALRDTDMSNWPDDWLKMKFGILQAVYMPGISNSELANNLSSVNMFRVVLNNYLGYDLNYLPDCKYSLYKGDKHEYNYVDVTAKLLGTASPECKNYEQVN